MLNKNTKHKIFLKPPLLHNNIITNTNDSDSTDIMMPRALCDEIK